MDGFISILAAVLLGVVIGLGPVQKAFQRGREVVIKRTLGRFLAPDHMTSAEEDPYFNREGAKPAH